MNLQDSFARRFNYLRLSVTELCNFRCNYCLPHGNDCDTPKNGLSVEEIATLVSAFAGLGTTKIRITGGEPALRKDLCAIIQTCKQTSGINNVALTTNGFKLHKDIENYKKAGLDAINVSADSLDPRMFAAITGNQKLTQITAGVERAINLGMSNVKLNTVLLKTFNYKELDAFFNFVRTRDVTWRFIELMQTGDNKAFFETNHVAGQQIKSRLLAQGWQRTIRGCDAGPAQEFTHPDFIGKIGLIMPYSKDFCRSCNRLRVSAQGKLHLCLFAEQGFSIREYLTAGDVVGAQLAMVAHLQHKHSQHFLHQGYTGATKQLASLGG